MEPKYKKTVKGEWIKAIYQYKDRYFAIAETGWGFDYVTEDKDTFDWTNWKWYCIHPLNQGFSGGITVEEVILKGTVLWKSAEKVGPKHKKTICGRDLQALYEYKEKYYAVTTETWGCVSKSIKLNIWGYQWQCIDPKERILSSNKTTIKEVETNGKLLWDSTGMKIEPIYKMTERNEVIKRIYRYGTRYFAITETSWDCIDSTSDVWEHLWLCGTPKDCKIVDGISIDDVKFRGQLIYSNDNNSIEFDTRMENRFIALMKE